MQVLSGMASHEVVALQQGRVSKIRHVEQCEACISSRVLALSYQILITFHLQIQDYYRSDCCNGSPVRPQSGSNPRPLVACQLHWMLEWSRSEGSTQSAHQIGHNQPCITIFDLIATSGVQCASEERCTYSRKAWLKRRNTPYGPRKWFLLLCKCDLMGYVLKCMSKGVVLDRVRQLDEVMTNIRCWKGLWRLWPETLPRCGVQRDEGASSIVECRARTPGQEKSSLLSTYQIYMSKVFFVSLKALAQQGSLCLVLWRDAEMGAEGISR